MFRNFRSNRCYIIAEIGGNFTTFEQAKRLIDEAHACGVDAVKLQTYRAETLTSRKAQFDFENTGHVSQFEIFQKYEIGEELHRQVFDYATSLGLDWTSTPSHGDDADMLEKLGIGVFKIGSDDATNLPFIRYIAKKQKPIIISTGMCTMKEVRDSVESILSEGNKDIYILHCVSRYPTRPEDANLAAMQSLMREFPGIPVGYSDHTIGLTAPLCSVAMGAAIMEKHFTYDKSAEGPDHMLSADPGEMRELVRMIREFEVMRGSMVKMPTISEMGSRHNTRKSVVLERDIHAGERIANEHVAIKRPGYGIAPAHLDQVIGRRAARDLQKEEILQWEDLA